MVVIREYTTPSGAKVRIHDDYMAPRGSEQEKRIIAEQRRAAHEILVSAAKRQMTSASA